MGLICTNMPRRLGRASTRATLAIFVSALLVPASEIGAKQVNEAESGVLSAAQIDAALGELRARTIALSDVSDPRYAGLQRELSEGVRLRRAVVLTPYARLAMYGSRIVGRPDPEVVARLAAPELWIVVFPYSRDRARALLGQETSWRLDPEGGLDGRGVTGGRVFVPKALELTTRKPARRRLEPLWVEARGFDFRHWFQEEWMAGRSFAVAFSMSDPAIVDRTGEIEVEGVLEEDGRDTHEVWSFRLGRIPARDWQRALGAVQSR